MKRQSLLRHLAQHGCELLREGGRHSIWWKPATERKSAVPRHNGIREVIVKKVCTDLEIPRP